MLINSIVIILFFVLKEITGTKTWKLPTYNPSTKTISPGIIKVILKGVVKSLGIVLILYLPSEEAKKVLETFLEVFPVAEAFSKVINLFK